jgi:O-methyltransferase involved in polyketide biosynthesis
MRECAASSFVNGNALMADLDHDPISYTALKVLQQRARNSTIPMCREMAEAAGVPWRSGRLRTALRNLVGGKSGSASYLQLRHDALSRALEAHRGCAVLELAAGFGTRGVLESEQREAYIETDLRNLVARKEQAVRVLRNGAPLTNHYFRALNVTEPSELGGITAFVGSLRLSMPLVILHEGLLMYFSAQEQAAVRDGIGALMKSHRPGAVWLTTDFSERDLDHGPMQHLMSLKLRGRVKRSLNYFADNAAVERFLNAGGLRCEWLPSADQGAYAEYFRAHRITLAPPA